MCEVGKITVNVTRCPHCKERPDVAFAIYPTEPDYIWVSYDCKCRSEETPAEKKNKEIEERAQAIVDETWNKFPEPIEILISFASGQKDKGERTEEALKILTEKKEVVAPVFKHKKEERR